MFSRTKPSKDGIYTFPKIVYDPSKKTYANNKKTDEVVHYQGLSSTIKGAAPPCPVYNKLSLSMHHPRALPTTSTAKQPLIN